MFDSFGAFIQAVWAHAITLAAGCVVTVMLGIIEKHILKRPVSAKIETAILLVFVFFACFQAWRDEHREALKIPNLQQLVKSERDPSESRLNLVPMDFLREGSS
jgi:hypothetical protein